MPSLPLHIFVAPPALKPCRRAWSLRIIIIININMVKLGVNDDDNIKTNYQYVRQIVSLCVYIALIYT